MRLFGLLLPSVVLVPAVACSSFGSTEGIAAPSELVDAQADTSQSPPHEDAGADGPSPDAQGPGSCPAHYFCDDFERDTVRGDWYYAPSTSAGNSLLEIDPKTASSGNSCLFAKTGTATSARANALEHKFGAAPLFPFYVRFALKRAALPNADVRIVRVTFDTGSSVGITLNEKGLILWMEAVVGGAVVSSGANRAETAPTGEWSRYVLGLEGTKATLERVNGSNSATIVPYSAEFGRAESASIGMPQIDPSTTSASFWLDDVVVPE